MAYSLVTNVSKSSDGTRELHFPAFVGEGVTVAVGVLVGVGSSVEVGMGVGVDGAVSIMVGELTAVPDASGVLLG